jgi:hypothetical protein
MAMYMNMKANITPSVTNAASKRASIARQEEIDGIA